MRHVLVTGGRGFIGRYVVEELKQRGRSVSVLDRHHYPVGIGEKPMAFSYFGDIKDATLVTDAVAHVDGVIHLAGVLGTQETIANPVPAAETNVLGGLNVINACAQYDVPLINIAVGNWWMNNTYSITKNTVERFVEMKHKYEGRAMASVRGLNAYGPRQEPIAPWGSSRVRKIMPSFCCRALSGEPIEVYGDGQQVMDMIFVTDLANVLVTALEALDAGKEFQKPEAGTGVETTVKEIAQEVVRAAWVQARKAVRIENLPMRPGEDEHSKVLARPETMLDLGIDASTFVPLGKGVELTMAYYVDRLK